MYIASSTGILVWNPESVAGAGTVESSAALTWTAGTTYEIDVRWWANGVVKVWRNSVLVIDATGADAPDTIDTVAYIGTHNASVSYMTHGRLKLIEVSK
jgi:hypothetical protein